MENNNPRISVIVPVYNAEKWLHRCVDSILSQTYKDFELLLIDDGSKDTSGLICEEYAGKDPRVRVFHKSNGGIGSARNVGLENLRGQWVTFCDADDYVFPQWLEYFSPEDEDIDLKCQGIQCDKLPTKGKKYEGRLTYGTDYSGDIPDLLECLHDNVILGYAVLKIFRTSILRKYNIRFDTSVKMLEDELFILQYACRATKGCSTSKAGYFYFVPDWNKKYNLKFSDRENVYKKRFQYVSEIFKDYKSGTYNDAYFKLQFVYMSGFLHNSASRKYCLRNLWNMYRTDCNGSGFPAAAKAFLRFWKGIFINLYISVSSS